MPDSLQPHGLQHARPPCISPPPRVCPVHVHWIGDAIQPLHPLWFSSPAFKPQSGQLICYKKLSINPPPLLIFFIGFSFSIPFLRFYWLQAWCTLHFASVFCENSSWYLICASSRLLFSSLVGLVGCQFLKDFSNFNHLTMSPDFDPSYLAHFLALVLKT